MIVWREKDTLSNMTSFQHRELIYLLYWRVQERCHEGECPSPRKPGASTAHGMFSRFLKYVPPLSVSRLV